MTRSKPEYQSIEGEDHHECAKNFQSINQSINTDFIISTQQQPSFGGGVPKFGYAPQNQNLGSDLFLLPLLFVGCTPVPNADIAGNYDLESAHIYEDSVSYKVKTDHSLTFQFKTNQGQILEMKVELHVENIVFFKKSGVLGSSHIASIYSSETKNEVTFAGQKFSTTNLSLSEFADGVYSSGYFNVPTGPYIGYTYDLVTGGKHVYDNTPCGRGIGGMCPI